MSIATEIQRLQQAKDDLKTSIQAKGVTVSSEAKLDDYPNLVDSIQVTDDSAYKDWIEGKTNDIPDGITKLRPYIFAHLKTLPVIPSSVTELGDYCFGYFDPTNLSVVIPDTVTKVGNYCFSHVGNNSGSGYVDVSISNITDISNTHHLFDTAYLKSLPTFNSSITKIPKYCFNNAYFKDKSIQIPSQITSLDIDAFVNAHIDKIIVPESVVELGSMSLYSSYSKAVQFLSTTPPKTSGSFVFGFNDNIYVPDEAVDTYKASTYFQTYASQIYPVSEMPE